MSETPNEEPGAPGDSPELQAPEAQRGLVIDAVGGAAIVQAASYGAQIVVNKLQDMVAGPADPPAEPAAGAAPDDGGFLDS